MHIAVWHNLPSGGGKRALADQVQGLALRGHRIEVWCPATADREFSPLNGVADEHVLPLRLPDVSRFGTYLPWSGYNAITAMIAALDAHAHRVGAAVTSGGFDLLYAHGCRFLAVPALARHVDALPTALYLQEPKRVLYEAMPETPWLSMRTSDPRISAPRHAWRFLMNLLSIQGTRRQAREEFNNAHAFRRVMVNSRFSRESVMRTYGIDARVSYLGIDTDRFRPQCTVKESLVIGVGNIRPHKNVRLVLEALARIPTPRPRLLWIGNSADYGYLADLRALAASLDTELEVRINVSDDELLDSLNRAQLMVYAPRLEPFGYAPLEANACGIPVVAVAEGGVRETVVDGVNGLLVEHDVDAIAAGINRLLDEPDLAERLGRQGRAAVLDRWSLDAAIDRLETELLAVVGACRPAKPAGQP